MSSRTNVVILGSTGSIGAQTLDVVREHPDLFKVVGLAARRSHALLQAQALEFGVDRLATFESVAEEIPSGISALEDLASMVGADIVVVAVSGVIGLRPTIAAIKAGKRIALASKEVLVAAGEVVMPMISQFGVQLLPVDSEHSAIFQCLEGNPTSSLSKVILTASGGPFRGKTADELREVTVEQALKHPTWTMGGKITIDSATLMNKALETIEAKWLFNIGIDSVGAVVHPQSIVHSFVEFKDGSFLAQLGLPNMRLPILYAMSYPERVSNSMPRWNPAESMNLTFEPVDSRVFPAIEIGKSASRRGGVAPCVFNAANEQAVEEFLKGRVSFTGITDVVRDVLDKIEPGTATLDSLTGADEEARIRVRESVGRYAPK